VTTLTLAECRVCGAGYGHATVTITDYGRTLLNCYRCGAGFDSYVDELAGELGITVGALLSDPLTHLAPWLDDGARATRRKAPAPLPDHRALRRACAALWADAGRLAYLTQDRGLHRSTVRRYRIGFDGCYTFPVFRHARTVNIVDHRPWSHPRYVAARGHPAALYPNLPAGQAIVLVAGMMDALTGRQHDVPAVTTTCGTSLPEHLVARFNGRRVAVVFDAGEEDAAERAVHKLRAAGAASAWVVPLPLATGGDVNDWLVTHGRSRDELLVLIREARP
jgi:hypothetical protein